MVRLPRETQHPRKSLFQQVSCSSGRGGSFTATPRFGASSELFCGGVHESEPAFRVCDDDGLTDSGQDCAPPVRPLAGFRFEMLFANAILPSTIRLHAPGGAAQRETTGSRCPPHLRSGTRLLFNNLPKLCNKKLQTLGTLF
jgi:hypothetical protein